MHVLAIDTATEVCGVALASETGVVSQERLDQGMTHAKVLMTAVQAVLSRGGMTVSSLDGLVVTRGPGSFTGLRIGISTIKGLAAASGLPIVSVSSLAVLACQAPEDARWVCPMIDARRREVYWSCYERNGSELIRVDEETAEPAGNVAEKMAAGCLFIGNGAQLYRQVIEKRSPHPVRFAKEADHALHPGVLALMGLSLLIAGESEHLDTFVPVYLRKSDAEMGHRAK